MLAALAYLEAKAVINADRKVTWAETVLMLAEADNLESKDALNADKKVIWVEIVPASSKIQTI